MLRHDNQKLFRFRIIRSHRSISERSYHRPEYTFSASPPPGDFERPIPVLFVCGEGFSEVVWKPYADSLARRGYCGKITTIDPRARNVRQAAKSIEASIKRCGLFPPVLVTHSLSSFVAQKFLESFSLTALVMINPFPIDPTITAAKVLRDYLEHSNSSQSLDAEFSQTMRRLYQIPDDVATPAAMFEPDAPHFPAQLLNELVTGPSAKVNLEPAPVPILLIHTTGDKYYLDNNLRHSKQFFDIPEDSIRIIDTTSRVPMLTNAFQLDDHLFDWIENVD